MLSLQKTATFDAALPLDGGRALPRWKLAYETYGALSATRDNVVLLCHTLTGDAHAAGRHSADDAKPGWWDSLIGPGRMLDTDRFFVVCSNVLGGCGGSTGPASIDPDSGRPYAMRFPVLTVADMVRAQRRLLDHLGIARLHTVIGGCLGGMQALEWARMYPADVDRLIVIGATASTSPHTVALWHTVRRCITSDPYWNGGDYYGGELPRCGLGLSMMMSMLLWMGRDGFERRFGRRTVEPEYAFGFEAEFEAERFLDDVAASGSAKFDANSLLYLTRAMDYFDLARGHAGLAEGLKAVRAPVLLVSYASDWRYPPQEMDSIRTALEATGAAAQHCVLESHFGHGAFLYDPASLVPVVRDFLAPDLLEVFGW